MIKKAPSYITSDGRSFLDLKDAQAQEIASLFPAGGPDEHEMAAIVKLVQHAEFVAQVLKSKVRKPRESKAVKTKKKVKKILEDAAQGKVPA